MVLFPAVVTAIAAAFAIQLTRQYRRRRRLHQLIWVFSLVCGALAGACFLLFLATDRVTIWFRAYYMFGALLMAAYLGMGSIALLAPRRWTHPVLGILVLSSVAGIVAIALAPLNPTALTGSNVEAGSNAITGPAIAFVAALNTFGAVAVVGGAAYSAWKVRRRSGPTQLLLSNALIALGTLIASLAGTLARVAGSGSYFWILLALGFVVLYGGFTIASRPPRSSLQIERGEKPVVQ